MDEGLSPSIYLRHIQEFADSLFSGTTALHKGHAQEGHQETSLLQPLAAL